MKIINSIAGEHIPEPIKIKNVYSRYRLDSGITHQKSPAHSLEIKIAGDVLPLLSRLRENTLRYRIFDPGGHMIRSVHMNCCLTAQISFMHFKGPGSFKIFFKICENIDELKGYRLILLTPPLFFHFTLPLRAKMDMDCFWLKSVKHQGRHVFITNPAPHICYNVRYR